MMRFTLLLIVAILAVSTLEAQQLPSNPDPDKCYVRAVTPDVYEKETHRYLTYSSEEAAQYSHIVKEITLVPELSQWETTVSKDCESLDPNDCQVLCYRTYPGVYDRIYEPITDLGHPFFREIERKVLVSKGGLSSYEEIDCRLMNFSIIPVSFAFGTAQFEEHRFVRKIIDNQLLGLLRSRSSLRVEVNVHTDAHEGSRQSQLLSEQRAQVLADYFAQRGIDYQRLTVRAVGESQLRQHCPENGNCTAAEHRLNNRIEFRVLSIE